MQVRAGVHSDLVDAEDDLVVVDDEGQVRRRGLVGDSAASLRHRVVAACEAARVSERDRSDGESDARGRRETRDARRKTRARARTRETIERETIAAEREKGDAGERERERAGEGPAKNARRKRGETALLRKRQLRAREKNGKGDRRLIARSPACKLGLARTSADWPEAGTSQGPGLAKTKAKKATLKSQKKKPGHSVQMLYNMYRYSWYAQGRVAPW